MPNSLVEHADLLWKLLGIFGAALVASVIIIARLYRSKISSLEETAKSIVKIIPKEALEKGIPLVTQDDCNSSRSKCPNAAIGKELTEGLKVIRRAILVLILYAEHVPQEERDKIVKGLVD